MGGGPDPRANFEVSLGELERCANGSMSRMSDAMTEVLTRWPPDTAVLKAVGSGPAMELVWATLGTMGLLHDQQVKARDATEQTRQALTEIAAAYRRADRFPGSGRGR